MTKTVFSNPIIDRYLADPYILKHDSVYYLFATGGGDDGRFIPIYRSKDLVNWEFVRGAVTQGPSPDSWNRRNFWAPEVYFMNNKFYLYYTAMPDGTPENTGNRVGLAVADSPEGPYEDVGVVVSHASIDGSLYQDEEGQLYLYYTIERENHDGLIAGQIYGTKMKDPATIEGDPVQLISHHEWQEGPCVVKRDGILFLTYSIGGWEDDTYNVRYAIGKTPLGPFEEQPNIILQTSEQVKGPGHHSIFSGPGDDDWLVYHGWDPAFTARYPRIDPLLRTGRKLYSDGPTS
jgi:beta-xylosidase